MKKVLATVALITLSGCANASVFCDKYVMDNDGYLMCETTMEHRTENGTLYADYHGDNKSYHEEYVEGVLQDIENQRNWDKKHYRELVIDPSQTTNGARVTVGDVIDYYGSLGE